MSEPSQTIVFVSASPKVDQTGAVSAFLAQRGKSAVCDERILAKTIDVRHAMLHHQTEAAYAEMQEADAIVFLIPLYFFCLPAMLTRFLQDFACQYPASNRDCSVYAIVNCGFPEPEINEEAMRVMECFALQTGRLFLGGVMVGGGGMVFAAKDAPFMRPVFEQIDRLFARVRQDVISASKSELIITQAAPKFPKRLYFFGGNAGWISTARKNNLRKRDLYRTPYQR